MGIIKSKLKYPSNERPLNMRKENSPTGPLRILIVCGDYPKISETFISSHITEMENRGHAVTVLTRGQLDRDFIDNLHNGKQTQFIESQNDSNLSVAKRLTRRYLRTIFNLRATILALTTGSTKERLMLSYQYPFMELLKIVQREGIFDICHVHFGVHGLWADRIKQRLNFCNKMVITFHGFDAWTVSDEIFAGYRSLANKPIAITANSFFTRDRLLHLGFPEDHTYIWRMGIQLRCHLSPVNSHIGRNQNAIKILSCGRLAPVKGHDDLIRAVAKIVKSEHPNVQLDIIGGGGTGETQRLETIIHELDAEKYIRLLGALPNATVWDHMSRADLFALTSKEDPHGAREAFGVVFLEASINGLPILATRSGGIPEVVIHEHTGLLAEENNVDDIAEKLGELLERRSEWPQFGQNGIAFVREHFSIKKTTNQLLEIYETNLSS